MYWPCNAVGFTLTVIIFLSTFHHFSSAASPACTSDQFQCVANSTCVETAWVCDGVNDCDDGSDEVNCPETTCHPDKFRCDDGECIDREWKCDVEVDCNDGSDEMNCQNRTCADNKFHCVTSQTCIDDTLRCDGDPDCDDRSDERDCPTRPAPTEENSKCPIGHVVCRRGYGDERECILASWVCDGDVDCPDGSDEHNCRPHQCQADEYACDKYHCIAKSKVCDGLRNCRTGSDEKDCPIAGCNITTSYLCNDGTTCILRSQLCDGHDDCPNQDDEERSQNKCFYNECQHNNGNCSHVCVNETFGYRCECQPGYKLAEDGRSCTDINECHTNVSNCDQRCINLKGSFRCDCYHGYEQRENGKCKLSKEVNAEGLSNVVSLVFANKRDIRKINLESGRLRNFMTVLVTNLTFAPGLTLDIGKRLLYWSDVKEEYIKRISLDQDRNSTASVSTIMSGPANIRSSFDLAMDWVHDHLYWTDYSVRKISVSFGDGSFPTMIVSTNDVNPYGIALHPGKAYMFISGSTDNEVLIRRYDMDGTNKVDIVTENLGMVHGIAVDYDEDRLFWVDSKLHQLASCDLDGKNRQNILTSSYFLRTPIGVAVFYDRVYWTDTQKIHSCNKWSGKPVQTIDRHLFAPFSLQIDHPHAQPHYPSHCLNHNCQFLCLPSSSGQGFTCACPNEHVGVDDTHRRCMNVSVSDESNKSPVSQTEPILENQTTTSKPASNLERTTMLPIQPESQATLKATSHHEIPATLSPQPDEATEKPTLTSESRSSLVTTTGIRDEASGKVSTTVQTSSNSHSSVVIALGVLASIVLLLLIALVVYRFYRRQSPTFNIKIESAIYRKTATDSAQDDIERKDSQALLILNESQGTSEEENEKRNSCESPSPDGSDEYFYEPIARVPTESENSSQIFVNVSDERRLMEI